jgi:hypothetical protein
MKAKLIKTPEQFYKLKFYNDEDMLACAIALLSKQNCDEIFGVFNVEKLAEEYFFNEYSWNKNNTLPYKDSDVQLTKNDFIKGFNKAMELNKDKVFTLEDMKLMFEFGYRKNNLIETTFESALNFIQSLQQPTEMEVEIEMEWKPKSNYCYACGEGGKYMETPCDHKNDCEHFQPKLDSEGCLILKKI